LQAVALFDTALMLFVLPLYLMPSELAFLDEK
jgi:hypothetical protein